MKLSKKFPRVPKKLPPKFCWNFRLLGALLLFPNQRMKSACRRTRIYSAGIFQRKKMKKWKVWIMAQGYGTKNESNTQNIFHGKTLNKNRQSALIADFCTRQVSLQILMQEKAVTGRHHTNFCSTILRFILTFLWNFS